MNKQSCPSLFTLTIGFIPMSIKRHFCNFDCESMSLVKSRHRHMVLSRHQSKTTGRKDSIFTNRFIEVHMVNIIEESNFNCCSGHKDFVMPNCYNFHQKKTWLIMAVPYLQKRLFHGPNMQRSLFNLFNLA